MTYCDFKPGDEVVCVNASHREPVRSHVRYPVEGETYTVLWVNESRTNPGALRCGLAGLEWTTRQGTKGGHAVWRFRKVQRRDLSAWLETATDFEEPKVKRAPVKERA